MSGADGKTSFWKTLPGILTGVAMVLTAFWGYADLFLAPTIIEFDADPPCICVGEHSTLEWEVSDKAKEVAIEPDLGPVATKGERIVSPNDNTTYTLKASSYLRRSNTLTANVTVVPPTVVADDRKDGAPKIDEDIDETESAARPEEEKGAIEEVAAEPSTDASDRGEGAPKIDEDINETESAARPEEEKGAIEEVAAEPSTDVGDRGEGAPKIDEDINETESAARDEEETPAIEKEPAPSEPVKIWYQDLGIGDSSEEGDQFGYSVATGDFNGDGYDDLAVGVPYEDNDVDVGAVNVLYGPQYDSTMVLWYKDLGRGYSSVAGDKFGYSVAAGDFNGDGCDDLAVGVPSDDNAGKVAVFNGSNDSGFKGHILLRGSSEKGDSFGWSLATGDFNGDGFDDLAVGDPNETVNNWDDAGAVHVFNGSKEGLNAYNYENWNQDRGIGNPTSEPKVHFGWSLATGDFNNDSIDDLAIGAPYEDIKNKNDGAGAVTVIYGSKKEGLKAERFEFWSQDMGIGGAELGVHFGWSLATGDFDKNGCDDLAIGVPDEDIVTKNDKTGEVIVLYGTLDGLTTEDYEYWNQSKGLGSNPKPDERFGHSVAAGDFNNDGFDDLAIGVPGEAIEDESKAGMGAVNVLYGFSGGLRQIDCRFWYQDLGRMGSDPKPDERFGHSVAAGDFNNDGFDDLAIGVPGEAIDGRLKAGAVNILYGER